MEVAGLEAGVDVVDGAENEVCRVAKPDSDLTTPMLAFVETAGVERLDTDTAGAAYGVKDISIHVKVHASVH